MLCSSRAFQEYKGLQYDIYYMCLPNVGTYSMLTAGPINQYNKIMDMMDHLAYLAGGRQSRSMNCEATAVLQQATSIPSYELSPHDQTRPDHACLCVAPPPKLESANRASAAHVGLALEIGKAGRCYYSLLQLKPDALTLDRWEKRH